MNLKTVEVEIDHGRVIPLEGETLPAHGRALLTILSSSATTYPRPSLRDLKPTSVGGALREYPDPDGDILGEMISNRS